MRFLPACRPNRQLLPYSSPACRLWSTPDGRTALRGAFTLIELLIVIAIISLLAMILFPVFARVRENARKTSCASNLKQLSLGMNQYVEDFDGRFPPRVPVATYVVPGTTTPTTTCISTDTTCVTVSWPDLIYPYVKNAQVFNDPSTANKYFDGCKFRNGTACAEPGTITNRPWKYIGVNDLMTDTAGAQRSSRDGIMYGYDTTIGNPAPPAHISQLAFPAEKLLLAEGTGVGLNSPGVVSSYNIMARHFSGVNIAFADGHVKWLSWDFVGANPSTGTEAGRLWRIGG